MAKVASTTKTKAIATRDDSVPAHLQDYESTGAGVPTDQKDFLIPMAKVLDAKSPECDKKNGNYVKGAEAGDILVKNAPDPLIKGEEGFVFQCCYRDEAIIEWLPRSKGGGAGGGFVARHPANFIELGKDTIQRPHPENRDKMIWFRKSTGNMLVETRYYGGYKIAKASPPLPLVLPFASTGHTVAKQWNMLIASKRIKGGPADIWLVYYRVKTRNRTRKDQSWYLFDITNAGPEEDGMPTTLWCPTTEDVARGKLLHEQLSTGVRKFADDDPPPDEGRDLDKTF